MNMKIRKILELCTAYNFDLDDELEIIVSKEPIKSGKGNEWERLKIDGLDLFTPTWYVGNRCRLIAKRNKKNEEDD